MKTVTTRKNKRYTTIFIHAFDDETLNKAVALKDSLEYAVIKPKPNAVVDYLDRHEANQKIEIAKQQDVGYTFDIAGFTFTKIEDMQGCFLSLRDNHAHELGKLCDFGITQYNNKLMENIFEKKTETLLYY